MSTIHTIHNLTFGFETQGFGRHESDAENAISYAVGAISRMKPVAAAALWAAAKHLGHGVFDGRQNDITDRLANLEYRAVRRATRGWSDNSDCHLTISAVDPD